jgi:hypothetical protein
MSSSAIMAQVKAAGVHLTVARTVELSRRRCPTASGHTGAKGGTREGDPFCRFAPAKNLSGLVDSSPRATLPFCVRVEMAWCRQRPEWRGLLEERSPVVQLRDKRVPFWVTTASASRKPPPSRADTTHNGWHPLCLIFDHAQNTSPTLLPGNCPRGRLLPYARRRHARDIEAGVPLFAENAAAGIGL